MRSLLVFLFAFYTLGALSQSPPKKIFDVHLHGSKDPDLQLGKLREAGVYKAAISTSWDLQNSYRKNQQVEMLYGLMFPCPNGKVPYSLQACYADGNDWPPVAWVEEQIREGRIDYLGEILTQYYGIPSSDSLLIPYLKLAEKYQVPVGFHTGGAGPGHGSPNFKLELGNPQLLMPVLERFPGLRVWIMHGGDQFYLETIRVMLKYPQVYTDISVISNPDIVPADRFAYLMNGFLDARLGNRLMFGTDNGDINKVIAAIESLSFLTEEQKSLIYHENAERFFRMK